MKIELTYRISVFMVDFRITWALGTGEVRNADRIWASTPQNLAYKEGKCLFVFRIHCQRRRGVLYFSERPHIFGFYHNLSVEAAF